MRCFEHSQVDAIGTCVYCGRGLCPRCHRVTNDGLLVCGDDCRRRVAFRDIPRELFVEEMSANYREYKLLSQICFVVSWVFAFFGACVMLVLGLIWPRGNFIQIGTEFWVGVILAAFLAVFAALALIAARRIRTLSLHFAEKAQRFETTEKSADQ